MKKYLVRILPKAFSDIESLYLYIAKEIFMPQTANNYVNGIYKTISQLTFYGGSIAPSLNDYIQRHYGPDARTVVYKKMTIIFNVRNNIIIIRRVIPSSLIT